MQHAKKPPQKEQDKTKLRQLANENKELRKEIKHLRREILKSHNKKETEVKESDIPLPKKESKDGKDWTCHKCNTGVLTKVEYTRIGESWYFRKCSDCTYRTRGKKSIDEKGSVGELGCRQA